MARYRDSIAIVSTRSARASIAPRVWRELASITLTHGSTSCVVSLKRDDGYGCIRGERTWFVCPSCVALAGSSAFAFDGQRPVGCRKCTPWRSREYRVTKEAPHVGNVASSALESVASNPGSTSSSGTSRL